MNDFLEWAKYRLSESSTWRGIIFIVTAFGVVISPEDQEKIVAAGLVLAGILNVAKKDAKSPDFRTSEGEKI